MWPPESSLMTDVPVTPFGRFGSESNRSRFYLMALALGLALIAHLVGASSAHANPSNDGSGHVWLSQATQVVTGSPLEGTVQSASLSTSGGVVLVSAKSASAESCTIALQLGNETLHAEVAVQGSVVAFELLGEGARDSAAWTLGGETCTVDVEGAVLFIGEASAYVTDNPSAYWSSVRASREMVVQ